MVDSFRRRPLTWLFAVAYACAMATAVTRRFEGELGGLLLIASLYIVGASAAVSQRHRLTRAAIFMAGAVAAVGTFRHFDNASGEHLALLILMLATPFFTAAVVRVAMRYGATSRGNDRDRWQISIMEILGWMAVVAIASAGLRFADFGSLRDSYENSLWAHGAVAGVLAGLFLTPERHIDRIAVVVASALFFIAMYVLPKVFNDWYDAPSVLAPIYAVFGLWILVLRLDEAAAMKPAPLSVVLPPPEASQDE